MLRFFNSASKFRIRYNNSLLCLHVLPKIYWLKEKLCRCCRRTAKSCTKNCNLCVQSYCLSLFFPTVRMRRGKIEPVVDAKAWQNYCSQCKAREVFWCCGQVHTNHDIIQKIEQTLKNTYTTKQKRTNNGFCNTKNRLFFEGK